jgi:outer membrane protein OmpA-like peptidoglycan-associated protein
MKNVITFLLLVFLLTSSLFSQNTDGRWTISLRGGGNVWFNDLSDLKAGPGGELEIGYGATRQLSIGLLTGWELLKSLQQPTTSAIPWGYLKAEGIPASLFAKINLSPGATFSPYLYAGVGGFFYQRRLETGYVPNNDSAWHTSIHVPVGIGFNAFASKNIAFTMDLSYRFVDDYTDYTKEGSGFTFDSYATAKAGLSLFFGSSDADDDDADGLTNGEEKKLGSNPENADSDGDGLRDGDEVNKHYTNPNKADTDDDGLGDYAEVVTHHTNPNKKDSDGDGLSDGDEVMKYKTDPLKLDSDGDGLQDGTEVSVNGTDPMKPDTDGDKLTDGDEVNKYKTDPLKPDTDVGSVDDGIEVARGTDPLNPGDDEVKVKVGESIVMEGIVFATGKADITPQSEETLNKAYDAIRLHPEVAVEIRGYTDNTGSAGTNIKLSQERAEAVKHWLVMKGISSDRIQAKGYGPESPIAPNTTKEGRQKNRRIEFFRTK